MADASEFVVSLIVAGVVAADTAPIGGWTVGVYLYMCVFAVFCVALVDVACEDLWKHVSDHHAT